MNQIIFTEKKEQLKQIIKKFELNNDIHCDELQMLNRLYDIIAEIYISNVREKAGLITYFILDSFDVKNFPVEEFLNFDKSLKCW